MSGGSETDSMEDLHVTWSWERRTFVVAAKDTMPTLLSPPTTNGMELKPSDEDLLPFKVESSSDDVPVAFARMQTQRNVVLERILSSKSPLRPLQQFLGQWQAWLSSVDANATSQPGSIGLADFYNEFVALARGWRLTGDIIRARSVLRKVFDALRRHLKAPCAVVAPQDESEEDQAVHAVAVAAKEFLLECVAFQTSLARCKVLAERHGTPPALANGLRQQLGGLLRQAPFALEVTALLANVMMQQQQQYALLTRFLEGSTLRQDDVSLTLVYVRALGYTGFYRQSLEATEAFLSTNHEGAREEVAQEQLSALKALKNHQRRLAALLVRREEAQEFQRTEQFGEAVRCFSECLLLVDAADHACTAALLFGRANALLETEELTTAMKDLKRSLQLDPSNAMASLRMRTVQLQVQTERIKTQLSGKKQKTRLSVMQ